MLMQGKKIGINLPFVRLKETLLLQQINKLLTQGAEILILPWEKTYAEENAIITSKAFTPQLVNKNFYELTSLLDILVFISPSEKLLKYLASKEVNLLTKMIPIVIYIEYELRGEYSPLKHLSNLLQQKNIYFVPFSTAYPKKESREIVNLCSRADLLPNTCSEALDHRQIKPVTWEDHFF